MLLALGLCALLRPVKDSLVRYDVAVVQHLKTIVVTRSRMLVSRAFGRIARPGTSRAYLENVRESFDDARVFVAIQLDSVDERDLRARVGAERLEDRCVFL